MLSLHHDRDKKEQDCANFRRMVRANHDSIGRDELRRLATALYDGGADEIERFLTIALSEEPFPI